MSKRQRVLVRYSQLNWGEIIHSSYESYTDENRTAESIAKALYSDPHVTSVQVVPLQEEKE